VRAAERRDSSGIAGGGFFPISLRSAGIEVDIYELTLGGQRLP